MDVLIDLNYSSEEKCLYLYLINEMCRPLQHIEANPKDLLSKRISKNSLIETNSEGNLSIHETMFRRTHETEGFVETYENSKSFRQVLKEKDFKPYFYVDADINDIKSFLKEKELSDLVENIEIVKKTILKDINDSMDRIVEKELCKIIVKYPKDVPKLRALKEIGVIYEHDIPFTKRYLIDSGIVPTAYFDFKNKKIINNNIPKLKAISFDMEVYCEGGEPDPEKDPILMTSFCSEDLRKVITYKSFEHEYIELVEDEKELIKKTIETLRNYDIIYTYNGDNFDFPYLKKRAKYLGIDVNLGKSPSNQVCEENKQLYYSINNEDIKISKGGMHLRSYIPGRVHIDLYPITRKLLNLARYKLEDVTFELFGINKLEVGHSNIARIWNEKNETLVEYSFQDAYYTYKIGEYFLPLEIMFSRIVNQTLFEISRMSSSQMVEYLLLKNSFKNNFIAPNKPSNREYLRRIRERYEGGYVKEPIKGIHDSIVSMDFKSLYPSIIISHNISPDTIDCKCCEHEAEKILGHWFCKKRIGIIPKTLKDLIERRKKIKTILKSKQDKILLDTENPKVMDEDTKSTDEYYDLLNYEQKSLKVLANSIYGYLAFPRARWYSKECAEVITYLGRNYIQKTMDEAEKFGFEVIYADTDGFYSKLKNNNTTKNKDELINKTYEFLEIINQKLPESMELEFEGYYKRGIFITKKRYALIDERDKITIKGLEFVRRDWSNIAKKTQRRVLETLLKEGDVEKAKKVIQDVINDLRNGKVDKKDLIIYTQLTKNIDEYKTTSPHVEVAKKIIKKKGRLKVGDVLEYIITSGNKSISERAFSPEDAKDYDINYYIENQVLPPVLRIMESLGISKDELKNLDKQVTLDRFF
ncbi:MAG: polymerase, archaea type [Methanothermococcus sp.]|uniref:DNA-directed DNA polymerase n=1 Tax=Methanothermococcus sp. TaxID=2614238 RepID=UPI00258FD04E|nr:DNA-directed DNA polymerase [Methanothermococcus sp.]MDK2791001.1 polymerase, archaea type [Methanothermococcus sp.]